jgi:hypothetical protein
VQVDVEYDFIGPVVYHRPFNFVQRTFQSRKDYLHGLAIDPGNELRTILREQVQVNFVGASSTVTSSLLIAFYPSSLRLFRCQPLVTRSGTEGE